MDELQAEIIASSVKRSEVGGLQFTIRCGDLERSAHIQSPHLFTPDELLRVMQDELQAVADEAAARNAVLEFATSLATAMPTLQAVPTPVPPIPLPPTVLNQN